MRAKHMLVISAVLAFVIALAMLLASRAFLAPLGLEGDDKVALLAQAQGTLLLGIAVINWSARNVTDPAALRAILGGNLVMQAAAAIVNVRGYALGLVTSQAFGQVAMHVLLGIGFAYFLARTGAKSTAAGAAKP